MRRQNKVVTWPVGAGMTLLVYNTPLAIHLMIKKMQISCGVKVLAMCSPRLSLRKINVCRKRTVHWDADIITLPVSPCRKPTSSQENSATEGTVRIQKIRVGLSNTLTVK